jgi:hypothetical protein
MRSTRTQNGACQLLFQVTFPFRGNSSACPVGIQQPLCVAGVEAYGTQSLDLSLLSLYQVLGLLNKAINGSELLRETGVRPTETMSLAFGKPRATNERPRNHRRSRKEVVFATFSNC